MVSTWVDDIFGADKILGTRKKEHETMKRTNYKLGWLDSPDSRENGWTLQDYILQFSVLLMICYMITRKSERSGGERERKSKRVELKYVLACLLVHVKQANFNPF